MFTPFKKNNFYFPSSNKNKYALSSSGNLFSRIKDSNNNNNQKPSTSFSLNNNHSKGRKLIEDFNKFTIGKNTDISNNIKNEKKEQILNIIINNNNTQNYNISNNTLSFLNPNNKKENQKEETEKMNDLKKSNKSNDNSLCSNTNKHNMFFTDYGLGYKCNCQKTQCNKYYCQCFREKRYCFNCNCQGCNNQKPEYQSSNKHPTKEEKKEQKEIFVTCTCTKSGCNKNYCECFKSGLKCNSSCRCRNCENCEGGKPNKNNKELKYECCLANSVFIVKNKLVLEDIHKDENTKKIEPVKRIIKIMINKNLLSSSSEENENVNKKRKRKNDNENEIFGKNIKNKKSKISDENSEEITKSKIRKEYDAKNSLFDKDGKLILMNFKL